MRTTQVFYRKGLVFLAYGEMSYMSLLRSGKFRSDEKRKRNGEHHEIRTDVENGVRDQMVYGCRALF